MQYWYRGEFSKGLDSITNMGVTFTGREPSEVRDVAAAAWFEGHPDYVRVVVEPAPSVTRKVTALNIPPPPPEPVKKPRKRKAKK